MILNADPQDLFGCSIDYIDSNWENKVVGNIMLAWIGDIGFDHGCTNCC